MCAEEKTQPTLDSVRHRWFLITAKKNGGLRYVGLLDFYPEAPSHYCGGSDLSGCDGVAALARQSWWAWAPSFCPSLAVCNPLSCAISLYRGKEGSVGTLTRLCDKHGEIITFLLFCLEMGQHIWENPAMWQTQSHLIIWLKMTQICSESPTVANSLMFKVLENNKIYFQFTFQ